MACTFSKAWGSILVPSTLTTAMPITESRCLIVPSITVPSGNDTSMESAASTASSGVRINISPPDLAITAPENCPAVSMGLSNQSLSRWME